MRQGGLLPPGPLRMLSELHCFEHHGSLCLIMDELCLPASLNHLLANCIVNCAKLHFWVMQPGLHAHNKPCCTMYLSACSKSPGFEPSNKDVRIFNSCMACGHDTMSVIMACLPIV